MRDRLCSKDVADLMEKRHDDNYVQATGEIYLTEPDLESFLHQFRHHLQNICITGGEPMLMSERVVEMIHRLRLQGYTGKIWLYTASSRKLKSYWACKMLIDAVDGITYTIHYGKMETVKRDLTDLRHLDTYLKESDRSGKSDRLYIDSRVFNQDYVDSLGYSWDVIKSLKWSMDDCPLPEGEELVYYDLEAEG